MYGGISGEPALGPPGYPHRLSAAVNPVAPIGHHWIDSTHVTFGLVTAGLFTERYKVEGSLFNGREPDDRRADVDLGALDSYSGRFTFAPAPRVTLQVSAAHLHEAEAQFAPQPRTDTDRLSASATIVAREGTWATTIAYGANAGSILLVDGEVRRVSHSVLIESTIGAGRRNTWFGRLELVGKPGHDLHDHAHPARVLPTSKLQGGYVRAFDAGVLAIGAGGTVAMSVVPAELVPRYGGRVAPSAGVFVVLRPRHRM